jgi:hypothetical protein
LKGEKDAHKRRQNLATALRHYRQASLAYEQPNYGVEWAQAKYNMADVFIAQAEIMPRRAKTCFAAARAVCEDAIGKLTIENREDWGRAQFNLAEAWHRQPDPTEADVERAIVAYQEVLRVYPRNFIPTEWSDTHLPLAEAYEILAALRDFDPELLTLAIASAKAACSVENKRYAKARGYRQVLARLEKLYVRHCRSQLPVEKIPAAE